MGLRLIGGRRIRWGVLVPLGVLLGVLLGCVLLSVRVYEYAWVCDRETGGALAQFPAFGNADIEPRPDTMNFEDCNAGFSTTASADRVVHYYRRQLTGNGWEVWGPGWYERRSLGEAPALVATRGDVYYYVDVAPSTGEGTPGTQVVHLAVKATP